MVKDHLFQLLINLFLFSENDISFSLDGCRVELRVLQNIGEDVNSLRDVGVERFGVVNSVFTLQYTSVIILDTVMVYAYRCISIEMATHVLNLEL
jgi:hypothetical protein